jgi:hypothetical protein
MADAESNHPSFSLGRKVGAGAGVVVACLSVLALTVMLNYLAVRHYRRVDVTVSHRGELSPRTLRVLESLPGEVTVIVYYDQQERLYKEINDLLREYASRNPLIKVRRVDPDRNPVEANLIRNKYRLATLNQKNLVLFDCKGKTKAVYQSALSDYELEPVANAAEREFRRHTKTFKGEQQFTSALVTVINPRRLKACFLSGHGEHDPASTDEQAGYSQFANLLRENGIQPEILSLFGTGEVPADCSLLVVAGMVNPLSEDELAKIDRYLNAGGRMLLLFNYRSFGKRTGLESLMTKWGVMVGESFALDPTNTTLNSLGQDVVLMFTAADSHPVTRPLALQSLQMLLPRPVSAIKSGGRGAEALKVDELAHTGPGGVLVRTVRNGKPEINPDDPRGVFSLIAAIEKGTVPGLRAERGSTRIIVAGDSMFLDNQLIESGANREFASHAVNWLVDQTYLLGGLGPRPVQEYRLNLTKAQMGTIHALLLGVMPASVLLLGALVWLRRRK